MVKGSVDMITTLIVINELLYSLYKDEEEKRKSDFMKRKKKEKSYIVIIQQLTRKVKYQYIDKKYDLLPVYQYNKRQLYDGYTYIDVCIELCGWIKSSSISSTFQLCHHDQSYTVCMLLQHY